MGNVVVIDSVAAGVGTSTLAALLARELSERYCGSCQSGMVCHCWHAIFGKPKIRNRGKCKRAFMRYRRCEAWSSSIWGNGTDCRI